VHRQHLLGPVRGLEPAIEDSLNDLARMGRSSTSRLPSTP